MTKAILDPLILQADKLALSFRHYAGNYKQTSRDNTYWQYRPYQGGESTTMIDWRQSARTETLYVREKTKEEKQTAYLWVDTSDVSTGQEGHILLLALSRLLLQENRKIVWLTKSRPTCTAESNFDTFAAQIVPPEHSADKLPPQFLPTRNAALIYCSDFQISAQEWKQRILQVAHATPKGVLLYMKKSTIQNPDIENIKAIASNSGWLFLTHTHETVPHQTLSKIMTYLCDNKS